MPSDILLEAAKKGINIYLKDDQLAFNAPKGVLDSGLKAKIIENKLQIIEFLKINRNSKENFHERHSSELGECVEPRNDLENTICEVWKEIFSINSISVFDNFFRLGGDSLVSMKSYVTEFQKKTGIVLHVRAIFEAQTIEEQAAYINKNYPGMFGSLNENHSVANKNTEISDNLKKLTADDFNDFSRVLSYEEKILKPINKKLEKPIVFILSPPRSGSTLLRVMLAGNRNLCAPEELELLGYNHLKERGEILNDYLSYKKDGLNRLIETIRSVDQKTAIDIMSQYEQTGKTIPAIYDEIISSINNRVLVDKTPSYSNRMTTLKRAEEIFENAKYIQLLRHPCGMINSFKEIRLDLLNPADIRNNIKYSPEQLAELLWVRSHRNINSFFENIPTDRVFKLKFEDLLANPEESCQSICQFIGVEYDGEMLFPYKEKQQRMTSEYRMLGDPKFHMHKDINPNVANKWSENINPKILSNETLLLALQMGYLDLPEPTADISNQQ